MTKAFENDRLVIWQGILGIRGEPTAMHRHELDLIGVLLDAGHARTRTPDGPWVEGAPFGPGRVLFQPRGVVHIEEQLVDGTRGIAIELKGAGGAAVPAAGAQNDADGKVHIDNERVLIREYLWSADKRLTRNAQGRDVVIVPLQSGLVKQTEPNGMSRVERLVFGQPLVRLRVGTVEETAQAGAPRAVVVELKP